MQVLLFFLFFAAIVAGSVYLCMQIMKKRREGFQLVARQLKMEFFPKGDERIAPMLSNLEFFMYGGRRKISNLIRGRINRNGKPISVAIFDYSFTIGLRESNEISFNDNSISFESNSDSETFAQTVLVFHDESLDLPGFSLRSENVWDKVANLVGYTDINFDDFPIFSKSYRLLSNRVYDIHDLFQPNLIKFYESNKICTEAIGPYLLVFPFPLKSDVNKSLATNNKTFTQSQYLNPDEIKPYLDLSLRLLNLLEKNTSSVRQ
jgi:hypothetical protein